MTDYKILIQNTTDKKYFVMPITDLDDSEIYYHVKGFVFPEGWPDGEYNYFIMPFTEGEITVDNHLIYVDGKEVEPLATGLIVLGNYKPTATQYNNKETFIQYE